MNILLISGGFIDADFAADFCREKHFDKMIAVDGGLKTCLLYTSKIPGSCADSVGSHKRGKNKRGNDDVYGRGAGHRRYDP